MSELKGVFQLMAGMATAGSACRSRRGPAGKCAKVLPGMRGKMKAAFA